MKTIAFIAFIVALLIVAVICLFFPERVQKYAIRSVNQGPTAKIKTLTKFVQSPRYLINVRIVGVLALLGFSFLLYMIIKNWSLIFG